MTGGMPLEHWKLRLVKRPDETPAEALLAVWRDGGGSLLMEEDTDERQSAHAKVGHTPEQMFTLEGEDDDVEGMLARRHAALSADHTAYALENAQNLDILPARGLGLEAENPRTDRSLVAEMLVSKFARSDLFLSGGALGEGSTGTVYRGILCDETEVAVKVMHTNMNEDDRRHALADLRQVFLPTPPQLAHQASSSVPSDLPLENHCSYILYLSCKARTRSRCVT